MSKTQEKAVWTRYRNDTRHLRKHGLHRTRIENTVESGTPDMNEAFQGREWWLEFKSCQRPKTLGGPVVIKWRPGQAEWLWRRSRAGCRAYLFLQVGRSHDARRYLVPGLLCTDLDGLAEDQIQTLSIVTPTATSAEILLAAAGLTQSVFQ